jgi:hypothetical protein
MNTTIILTSLTGLLAISTLAQAGSVPAPNTEETTTNPRLEQRLGPEERARMRRELRDDLGKTYPDHEEIDSRRQIMRERMQERLKRADGNGDGAISRAEAEQSMPGIARHFDSIDIDRDGTISREEMRAAHEKMREAREQHQEIKPEATPADAEQPPRRRPKRHRGGGADHPPPHDS